MEVTQIEKFTSSHCNRVWYLYFPFTRLLNTLKEAKEVPVHWQRGDASEYNMDVKQSSVGRRVKSVDKV